MLNKLSLQTVGMHGISRNRDKDVCPEWPKKAIRVVPRAFRLLGEGKPFLLFKETVRTFRIKGFDIRMKGELEK